MAGAVAAQGLPTPANPYVTDLANLLTPADAAQLAADLTDLKAEHGVELTVLTLRRLDAYPGYSSIDSLASAVFNDWGVGDRGRNDGILVLIAHNDREMRIELGSGYDTRWNAVAQVVIDDAFLPHFRAENYPRGILTGAAQTVQRIALPFAEGREPEDTAGDAPTLFIVLGAAGMALLALVGRKSFGDRIMRFRTCPSCGRRGLSAERSVIRPAKPGVRGQGRRNVRCRTCDYHDETYYPVSIPTKDENSGGFGGGSSSGGGASGKW